MKNIPEDIRIIVQIFQRILWFYSETKYLHSPQNEKELVYINGNQFLTLSRHTLWTSSVLEICKLYGGKSEHFHIGKILNEIENKPSKLKRGHITIQNIKDWKKKIDYEFTPIISSLIDLRDKYYAHRDREPAESIMENLPTFKDLEELLDFTETLIKELHIEFTDSDIIFRSAKKGDSKMMVERILEWKELKTQELAAQLKNKNLPQQGL